MTLRYVSPFWDPQTSLVINVYFLIYFLVYLESGGRFKFEFKFGFETEFDYIWFTVKSLKVGFFRI